MLPRKADERLTSSLKCSVSRREKQAEKAIYSQRSVAKVAIRANSSTMDENACARAIGKRRASVRVCRDARFNLTSRLLPASAELPRARM